jgi:outer membrane protein
MQVRLLGTCGLAVFLFALNGRTQTVAASSSASEDVTRGWGNLAHGYRVREFKPVSLENSSRLMNLTRDGKLYLSLKDAIALALENNLDIELERYAPRIADTDLLRARSGNFLRGVPLTVREGPSGLGEPQVTDVGTLGGGNAPALNALVGPRTETDLSIIGSIPLSTGPALPNLDPTITGTAGWDHASAPQNNSFLSNIRSLNSDTTTGTLAFEKGFLTGGSLNASWINSYQKINNPLYSFNPATYSSLNLTFTHPLLRGFGWAVNDRYIRIGKNNRNVSDRVFEQQLITTVASVARLYWDLVSLERDISVRSDALVSAQKLLTDNKASVEEGTLAPIDVTRAEAEVARRERDLTVSQTLARQQELIVKDFLTRTVLKAELANVPIVPTETTDVPNHENFGTIDELAQRAFKTRPDLEQARLQLENSRISLKGSRNAVLPSLDLRAGLQENALVGDVNRFSTSSLGPIASQPDPFFLGNYGDAMGQLFHHNFPDYDVGVSFNVPLANRAARADVARDQLQVRQQQIRLRQLEKQVWLEVQNALIAVQQARETFKSAQRERILQEQTVESEVEKLSVGATTSYLVIQYQRDLAQARSAEISAASDYFKSRISLERATGTILSDNGIVFSEALSGEVQRTSTLPAPPK